MRFAIWFAALAIAGPGQLHWGWVIMGVLFGLWDIWDTLRPQPTLVRTPPRPEASATLFLCKIPITILTTPNRENRRMARPSATMTPPASMMSGFLSRRLVTARDAG